MLVNNLDRLYDRSGSLGFKPAGAQGGNCNTPTGTSAAAAATLNCARVVCAPSFRQWQGLQNLYVSSVVETVSLVGCHVAPMLWGCCRQHAVTFRPLNVAVQWATGNHFPPNSKYKACFQAAKMGDFSMASQAEPRLGTSRPPVSIEDPIYGRIELHHQVAAVLHTSPIMALKEKSQLGLAHYVRLPQVHASASVRCMRSFQSRIRQRTAVNYTDGLFILVGDGHELVWAGSCLIKRIAPHHVRSKRVELRSMHNVGLSHLDIRVCGIFFNGSASSHRVQGGTCCSSPMVWPLPREMNGMFTTAPHSEKAVQTCAG